MNKTWGSRWARSSGAVAFSDWATNASLYVWQAWERERVWDSATTTTTADGCCGCELWGDVLACFQFEQIHNKSDDGRRRSDCSCEKWHTHSTWARIDRMEFGECIEPMHENHAKIRNLVSNILGPNENTKRAHEIEPQPLKAHSFDARTWLRFASIEHDSDIYCRNYSRNGQCSFVSSSRPKMRHSHSVRTHQMHPMWPDWQDGCAHVNCEARKAKPETRTNLPKYKSRNFKFVTKLTNLNSQKPTNNENGVKFKAFFLSFGPYPPHPYSYSSRCAFISIQQFIDSTCLTTGPNEWMNDRASADASTVCVVRRRRRRRWPENVHNKSPAKFMCVTLCAQTGTKRIKMNEKNSFILFLIVFLFRRQRKCISRRLPHHIEAEALDFIYICLFNATEKRSIHNKHCFRILLFGHSAVDGRRCTTSVHNEEPIKWCRRLASTEGVSNVTKKLTKRTKRKIQFERTSQRDRCQWKWKI